MTYICFLCIFIDQSDGNSVRSFKDGKQMQPENGQVIVRLEIYFDDFSLGDTGSPKICAVYFTVNNLPYEMQSCRSCINLVLACTRDVLNVIGIKRFFAPLIRDLKKLRVHGMTVSGFDYKLKGYI